VPADGAAVRAVVVAAFTPAGVRPDPPEPAGDAEPAGVPAGDGPRPFEPVEAGLLDALRTDPAWIDSGWVVERDGGIVAHALVVPVRVGDAAALALGMVAVHPAHQRRGHGAEVVWAVIHDLVRRSEPLAVVLGSPAYYGRFGFVSAPVVGVHSPRYPAPFLQALALRVGHPRGAVEYPRPYTDLPD
jgi:putative acetyltransferase